MSRYCKSEAVCVGWNKNASSPIGSYVELMVTSWRIYLAMVSEWVLWCRKHTTGACRGFKGLVQSHKLSTACEPRGESSCLCLSYSVIMYSNPLELKAPVKFILLWYVALFFFFFFLFFSFFFCLSNRKESRSLCWSERRKGQKKKIARKKERRKEILSFYHFWKRVIKRIRARWRDNNRNQEYWIWKLLN